VMTYYETHNDIKEARAKDDKLKVLLAQRFLFYFLNIRKNIKHNNYDES